MSQNNYLYPTIGVRNSFYGTGQPNHLVIYDFSKESKYSLFFGNGGDDNLYLDISLSQLKRINGDEGNDKITLLTRRESFSNYLNGGNGNDNLYLKTKTSAQSNQLNGGNDNDKLSLYANTLATFNKLNGGDGDDILTLDAQLTSYNQLNGGSGDDDLTFYARVSAVGNQLNGDEGNDKLTLFGWGNSSALNGGDGNDIFRVDAKGDILLTGGEGADNFMFLNNAYDGNASKTKTISDYNLNEEKIYLSSVFQPDLQQIGDDILLTAYLGSSSLQVLLQDVMFLGADQDIVFDSIRDQIVLGANLNSL